MIHPTLHRQLRKAGLADPTVPASAEAWPDLVERISRTYTDNDNDRYTIERSLSLVSEEMQALHRKLEQQNALLYQVLTSYVAKDVAQEILANPEKRLRLGGETRLVSVLFCDIRNYTAFSKTQHAHTIVQVLNQIFGRLAPIVFEELGILDKFMGDSVLAFFGAPVAHPDDALRAVRTALKFRDVVVALRAEDATLADLTFGAGIFTGYAVVGNVGSERLMSYTCIGEPPTSAKLFQESAGADQILICPATYEAARDGVEASPTENLLLSRNNLLLRAYEVRGLRGGGAPLL